MQKQRQELPAGTVAESPMISSHAKQELERDMPPILSPVKPMPVLSPMPKTTVQEPVQEELIYVEQQENSEQQSYVEQPVYVNCHHVMVS